MPIIALSCHFVACHLQMAGVNNYYIVTTVYVSGDGRLAFANQEAGCDRRDSANRRITGINDVPLSGYFGWFSTKSLHLAAPAAVLVLAAGFVVSFLFTVLAIGVSFKSSTKLTLAFWTLSPRLIPVFS